MKREPWALLAVTDRTGIIEFAYSLTELGFKIAATGGTLAALRQAELHAEDAREAFGEPAAAVADDQSPIGLVAVNLYPVAEIVGDSKLSQDEVLEYIDLAGSALLRAAARGFRRVIPLCDPDDYQATVDALRQYKRVAPDRRQRLAAKAFHYSAYYDTTVAQYLGDKWDKLPDELVFGLKKTADLHYGENPQQQGALYALSGARPWGVNAAQLVYGKPLSYNHYLDLEVAWELATEIGEPACAIVKHAVPAGLASSERLADAARLAYRCDPRGCFRGTAAVNRELEEDAAALLAEETVACIAAPQFSHKALQVLKSKKEIRLVTLPSTLISAYEVDLKTVAGGLLVQEKDQQRIAGSLRVVTRKQPGEVELKSLRLAWHAAKHARTHAAVLCRGSYAIGIGSGQTSRLDAVRLACVKSQERHPIVPAGLPIVMASDGALSAEHVSEAAQNGVVAIIQPGGSSDDRDAIEAADARGLAMVFTGVRHFRH